MPSKKSGFTLIELLIVIAIIGILASVILVSLSSARTNARIKSAETTLNQLHKSIVNYYITNGNEFPPGGNNATFGAGGNCNIAPGSLSPTNVTGPEGFAEADPWGNCYSMDGSVGFEGTECFSNPNSATVCSAGPDGNFNGFPWNKSQAQRDSEGLDDICMNFTCN